MTTVGVDATGEGNGDSPRSSAEFEHPPRIPLAQQFKHRLEVVDLGVPLVIYIGERLAVTSQRRCRWLHVRRFDT